jgi:hypothetical protein
MSEIERRDRSNRQTRFGVPGGSSFVDARHPFRLASLLRSQSTEASHHAAQLEARSQSACRLQAWLFKYDYITDSESRSRQCQERPRNHLEPRIMSRIPGPILSLTRVAVKRRANSISQARWLDRAIHRAGQLIVSCL